MQRFLNKHCFAYDFNQKSFISIPGACSEYLKNSNGETEEPRVLGLVMVPGRHIVSIKLDDTTPPMKLYYDE